jgi:hypothetical protein
VNLLRGDKFEKNGMALQSRLIRSARPFVPSSQSFDNATMGIGIDNEGRQPGN